MINKILNKYMFDVAKLEVSEESVYESLNKCTKFAIACFLFTNIPLFFMLINLNFIRHIGGENSIINALSFFIFLLVFVLAIISIVLLLLSFLERLINLKPVIKNLKNRYIQFDYNENIFSFPGYILFDDHNDLFLKKIEKEEVEFFINEFKNNGYSEEKIKEKMIERLNDSKRYNPGLDITLNDMAFIGLNLYKENEVDSNKVKKIVNNFFNDK